MKSQNLNGAALADRVEQLTGERPNAMRVSRWLNPEPSRVLIRISPDLALIAAALQLDPVELACDAIRQAHAPAAHIEQFGVTPNPYQSSRCEHPNLAGYGCQACCDACNEDRHHCHSCGQPVGHLATCCDECPNPGEE